MFEPLRGKENVMNKHNDFVVIYGSMAALLTDSAQRVTSRPRDIDIAVGGGVSFDDAERRARSFMASRLREAAGDVEARLDTATRATYGRTLVDLQPAIDAGVAAGKKIAAMERDAHESRRYIGGDQEFLESLRVYLDGGEAERQRAALLAEVAWPETLRTLASDVATGRIPVDIRRYRDEDGTVVLPTPKGVAGSAMVIRGDVSVRWQDISSIPGILRSGLPPRQAAGMIQEWLRVVGGDFAHVYREFNLLPTRDTVGAYVTSGVTALRSARTHVSDEDWSIIVGELGAFGRLLDWMLRNEPSAEVVARYKSQTPGSAPGFVLCIDLERERLFTAYGDFFVSFDDAPRVLGGGRGCGPGGEKCLGLNCPVCRA